MTEFRKTDLIIPAAGFLAALIIFGISYYSAFAGGRGNTVNIYVDGVLYKSLPLSRDTDIVIPGACGMDNRLVIRNGEADITDALCPDRICVHEKKIKYAGETLVCLPNKVVVEIEGARGGIDAVSK